VAVQQQDIGRGLGSVESGLDKPDKVRGVENRLIFRDIFVPSSTWETSMIDWANKLVLSRTVFFRNGSIAPASASIDAHSLLLKVLKFRIHTTHGSHKVYTKINQRKTKRMSLLSIL
jgi:hypothetical protein